MPSGTLVSSDGIKEELSSLVPSLQDEIGERASLIARILGQKSTNTIGTLLQESYILKRAALYIEELVETYCGRSKRRILIRYRDLSTFYYEFDCYLGERQISRLNLDGSLTGGNWIEELDWLHRHASYIERHI